MKQFTKDWAFGIVDTKSKAIGLMIVDNRGPITLLPFLPHIQKHVPQIGLYAED